MTSEGIFSIAIFFLVIIFFWVIPIWLGLKWARIKGISRLWMLFGFHPITGWVAFLVIRYGVDPRKQCGMCKETINMEAIICRYCGNQMSQEEINLAKKDYEYRRAHN